MAQIGPAKKVYSIPEPQIAPVFTKPIRTPATETERELVPSAPKKVGA